MNYIIQKREDEASARELYDDLTAHGVKAVLIQTQSKRGDSFVQMKLAEMRAHPWINVEKNDEHTT